jgi:hypothetical protein
VVLGGREDGREDWEGGREAGSGLLVWVRRVLLFMFGGQLVMWRMFGRNERVGVC